VRYVLDTNVVIAALKQHAGVLSKLADVEAADVGIPLLVVGELMFGRFVPNTSRRTWQRFGDSGPSSPFFQSTRQ
jgi:predicted nucleic acid-binding protein